MSLVKKGVKELVLGLITSALVTSTRKEAPEMILDQVSYIHYPVQFRKDKEAIKALINSDSEVNAITPVYTKKLGLWSQKTDVGAQKIVGLLIKTYGIVVAIF